MTETLNNSLLSMNSDIIIFRHPQFGDLRVRIKKNGKSVFSALNIAKAIGYPNPKDAVTKICQGGVTSQFPVEDGFLLINFIKHRDVYRLVNNLWNPHTKAFLEWFEDVILPAIRNYKAQLQNALSEESISKMLGMFQQVKDEKDQRAEIEIGVQIQNNNNAKIIFVDAMIASGCSMKISTLAKMLQQNDVEIDEDELCQWMRDNGYLGKDEDLKNHPTKSAMDRDLFQIVYNRTVSCGKSTQEVSVNVTAKGMVHFLNEFLS